MNIEFLRTKPTSFSKRQIHKVGTNLRKGISYDEDVLDQYLEHQAQLCSYLLEVATDTMNCLLKPFEHSASIAIAPDSGAYQLTARVKTKDTLVEKLRRMRTYPLENIMDVAGVRFDGDLTLTEQTMIAEMFKRNFENAGIDAVEVRDMRDTPHSGYRAIHLHLFAPAGRAEFQIRTAMQAQWANLYEVAADIFGREIRYLEFGEQPGPGTMEEIRSLHTASEIVHDAEKVADRVFKPFTQDIRREPLRSEVQQLRKRAYGILEEKHAELNEARSKIIEKGK